VPGEGPWIDTDVVKGAEADLPSFPAMRRELPYPRVDTTSLDKAAAAIVDGLVSRRSRVYVPRGQGLAGPGAALGYQAAWLWARRFAAKRVSALEREIAALRNEQALPRISEPAD
jgi:hypothetical protein